MKSGALILGGLVAGLWINLSGMALVHFMLGPAYVARLLAHLPEPAGSATLVRHLAIRFGLGILGVLLYLAVRPQLATTVSAAVVAGTFLFLFAYVPLGAMLNEFGVLTGWQLWATLAWGAVEAIVALLLGARLYERLSG